MIKIIWLFHFFLHPLVSGQEFDFSVTRLSETFPNILTLICEDITGAIDNPMFFRGTERIEVPDPSAFTIDRSLEGDYTCGIETRFTMITSQPPMTIIARPDPRIMPSDTTVFFSEEGATARLDCSITPGRALQQYYVIWKSAINDTIFYESFPPIQNRDPFVLNPERYFIDSQNFSLFINDVTLADEIEQYLCILAVEDPLVMQNFMYTRTETIRLSLSIFSAPDFVAVPTDQIVTNGADVEFSCSVVSSPEPSLINWVHRGSVVQRGDENYNIDTVTRMGMEGGRVTESTLTIFNVTGFDSSLVECVAEYFADGVATVTATDRRSAVLGVLDEVSDFSPVPLETGGFIFKTTPKEPLPIPVTLRLIFTEVETEQVDSLRSTSTFFNTSPINYIAFREEVQFDVFRVDVALEHNELVGPFFNNNIVYERAGISTTDIALYSVVGFLGLFFVLFILFTIIVLSLWFRSNKALRAQLKNVTNLSFKQSHITSCFCCTSGGASLHGAGQESGISENGFTKELAEFYVKSIAESIRFGKSDTQIRKVLAMKQISCGPMTENPVTKNPEPPLALEMEETVPTSGNGSTPSDPPMRTSDSNM